MKLRVVVLGAGFGGLEISTILSEKLGDNLDLTLIDKNDSFYFGFSKFDVMFGHKTPEAVKLYYNNITKPGVKFIRDTVTSIDPVAKTVVTQFSTYKADILVIALGADYDISATPGLAEGEAGAVSARPGAAGADRSRRAAFRSPRLKLAPLAALAFVQVHARQALAAKYAIGERIPTQLLGCKALTPMQAQPRGPVSARGRA